MESLVQFETDFESQASEFWLQILKLWIQLRFEIQLKFDSIFLQIFPKYLKIFQNQSWRVFNVLKFFLRVHRLKHCGFLKAQLITQGIHLTLRKFRVLVSIQVCFHFFGVLFAQLPLFLWFHLTKSTRLRLNTLVTLRSITANLCGNLQDAISRRVKDTRAVQNCIPWPAKNSPGDIYLQANRRGEGEVKCRRTIVQKENEGGWKEDRDYRLHYKSLLNFTRQKFDMCSLLFCVSSISSINLKSLLGSLVDKEPNVTLYAVTTTCAYIFTSRTEECWCWTRPIFKSPDTNNSPTWYKSK